MYCMCLLSIYINFNSTLSIVKILYPVIVQYDNKSILITIKPINNTCYI